MSRRGNSNSNAVAKSFFHLLKTERTTRNAYKNGEAGKGEPLQLVDSEDSFWSVYDITKIKEGQSFIDGTGMPYKQTFRLDIKVYCEDAAAEGAP